MKQKTLKNMTILSISIAIAINFTLLIIVLILGDSDYLLLSLAGGGILSCIGYYICSSKMEKMLEKKINNPDIENVKKLALEWIEFRKEVYNLDASNRIDIQLQQFINILKKHSDLSKAESMCSTLGKNTEAVDLLENYKKYVIQPFKDSIGPMNVPLSASDKQIILEELINLAMISYDVVDTFNNKRNARKEQYLNVGIAAGELTRAQALQGAKHLSHDPLVTDLWIINIDNSLSSHLREKTEIIFSGYKKI